MISGGPEEGALEGEPIAVDGELERGHLRVDVDAPAGDRVSLVPAEHLVEGVVDVEATDVPVSGPTQVIGVDVMEDRPPKAGLRGVVLGEEVVADARYDRADRRGADDELVPVEV